MRCVRAKRTCGGYEATPGSTFRAYGSHPGPSTGTQPPAVLDWSPRKCSLPKRVLRPDTNTYTEDARPAEKNEFDSMMYSVRAFFYDFCLVSTNRDLSRGYLTAVQDLCRRQGPASDLVKACAVVAFSCHCKPLNRPSMYKDGEPLYLELLGNLAHAIKDLKMAGPAQTRLLSMLLGLYQICMDDERNYGVHRTHAKGLAALMDITTSPLSIASRVFSKSCWISDQDVGLDVLFLELNLAWERFQALSLGAPGDPETLRDELLLLNSRFAAWEASRGPEFKPTTVSQLSPSTLRSTQAPPAGFWPGNVDTYFDLYVAGVWNVSRAARLLLFHLLFELSGTKSSGNVHCADHMHTATRLAEDMLASLPYHLTENLQVFLAEAATSTEIKEAGRFLGGYLVMHPLYVVSRMAFLPREMRYYARRCLEWVGSEMGIGQASFLATAQNLDREYLESGCMIIWSGFLM